MKIIKYLFLLLLLAIVGLSVYIATQNGDYTIKRSTFINVPKEVVYNYISDYRNWDQWLDLQGEKADFSFTYSDEATLKDGFLSWTNGTDGGTIKSLFVKENDSIVQELNINDKISQSTLTLNDSIGGTKLSWTVIGKADFLTKIKGAFTSGIAEVQSKMFQNSLNNVNAIITKEISTYSVQVIGQVKIDSTYYVKQTATEKIRDLNSKITSMLQRMDKFFKNGNLAMNGKPFVIYESTNAANETVTFSVCGPLKEEIFVSDPSDVSIEKLQPFTALKTVLKGDYSHRDKALDKALKYISDNKLNQNTALKYLDIYTVNASDEKSPSKWVTEILIPIQAPAPVVPRIITAPTIKAQDLIVE